jgi:hypothetical protein
MSTLKELVFGVLDHAIANGYDHLLFESDETVAINLAAYDASLEHFEVEAIVPHVAAYRKERGK